MKTCDWFYDRIKQRFKRFGSAKVVRSLYKRKTDCKYREMYVCVGVTHALNSCVGGVSNWGQNQNHNVQRQSLC